MRNLYRGSMGSLLITLMITASWANAAEPELLYHWSLSAEKASAQQFTPIAGNLPAKASAPPAFAEAAPHALQLTNDQRLTITDDPTKVTWPTESLTVSAWAMIDQPQEWGGIVSALQDNGNYERGWLLGFRGSAFCFGLTSEKANRLTYLTAGEEFAPGNWYHVAATYDGTTMQLFIDGRLAAKSTAQQGKIVYPPKIFFDLGAYHDDNELYPAKGELADVRIYRGALSAEAIKASFDSEQDRFPGAKAEVAIAPVKGWPTYMRDNARSGISGEALQLPLQLAWKVAATHRPNPAWPPPAKQDFWHNKHGLKPRVTYDRAFHVISDGEHVWFGSSADDQVRCLDLATGQQLWSYFTEGPVRLAPTLHQGRVYFGSDDGCAYCLNATTGELVWKKRAVETDRRMPGNGRVISTWPIRTGILIDGNHARFAAGLFPTQGVYQFVLDAETGKELARGQLNFSAQGYMELQGNRLIASQGRAPKAFVDRLKRTGKTITPKLEAMPEEYPLAMIGAGPHRFAAGSNKIAALSAENGRELWTAEVDGDAYSMAVAGGALLVSTSEGNIYCFRSQSDPTPQHVPGNVAPKPSEPRSHLANEAKYIREAAATDQGWCLTLGSRTGEFEQALCQATQWKIVAVTHDDEATTRIRERLVSEGLAGRVSVHQVADGKLPYQSQLFNMIAFEHESTPVNPALPAQEVMRLLRPGGIANSFGLDATFNKPLVEWLKGIPKEDWQYTDVNQVLITKPATLGTGQWSHMYADPANTSCSNDQVVGNKFHLQWFGQPGPRQMLDRHHRTVPPLVADGRMFVPADNRVIAVDAYNGTILWDKETPYSRRVAAMRDAGSMAATNDRIYVATAGECLALDATSGEQKLRAAVPPVADGQPRHWGYVAIVGDSLFGSATKPGASRSGHSRRQIDETYWDNVPIVTSDSLFRLDRHTGEQAWHYEPTGGALLNPTFTIGGGRVYFMESKNPATLKTETGRSKLADFVSQGVEIVALERDSGQELWRREVPMKNVEQHLYLCYAKEKLIAVGTRNERNLLRTTVRYDTLAFSAVDGKSLWQTTQDQGQGANGDHGEQDHHPTIVGDTVIVEPKAYDLNTGEMIANWKFARGGHGCGSLSASADTIFFRAGNPTMFDLDTGVKQKVTEVSRPGCWINIIPAGGLLLIPEASSGCTCNFSIQASMAFGPAE